MVGPLAIFWKQLDGTAAIDILGWRVLWTFLLVTGVVVATGRRRELSQAVATPRARLATTIAALLIATNWATYVWAVGADRVTEASLGYFMNPLMSVALGVIVLRERLRARQWIAVVCAAVGVAWLTLVVGSLPWVSLTLAGTFALYGLIRKLSPAGPMIGLDLEMILLIAPALLLIGGRRLWSDVEVLHDPDTMLWLALTGVVTAVPLVWFAAAARRIPLAVLGLLQFLAPTLQFLLGVVVYDEPFSASSLVGYAVIWVGLVIFVADAAGASGRWVPTHVVRSRV